MRQVKHKTPEELSEPRDWWGAKYFSGDKPGDKARTERQWWLDTIGEIVPAGWAARAYKRWFTPKATRDAVAGEGPAAQAYQDWKASKEGTSNGQEA